MQVYFNKMKKAVIISSYVPLSRLKRRIHFLEDEYDVHLIYWNRNDEGLYSNFSSWCNDVREVHIPVLSSIGNPIKRVPQTKKFKRIVKKMLNEIKPDILLLQDLDMLISFHDYAKKNKCKIIYEVRDLHYLVIDKQKGIKRLVQYYLISKEKQFLKDVDLLIMTSDGFYDGYYFDKIPKDKTLFIPNCPEEIGFKDYAPQKHDTFTIGFIGVVRYFDQLKLMVDIAEEENVKLIIRGIGIEEKRINAYVQNKKNVISSGRFEYEKDAARMYQEIDAIFSVYDSKENNVRLSLPNRLYDAIMFSKPIIVAKDTHMAKIVNELGIGAAIDCNSKEELRTLVKSWMNYSDEYSKCVDNCKKAISLYSAKKSKQELLEKMKEFKY